ncbi:hypothetical protein NliqN6_3302 [Naganishia liquefaciens]|uniref:Uncharacterized protein n=1 Tax=Naganishia liquefaciens TaxID=104408 RepID=A0A8H3TTE4_9TREE|nr:hypothetical protein NliqN6_3302 [Naganishia liquefaciens]
MANASLNSLFTNIDLCSAESSTSPRRSIYPPISVSFLDMSSDEFDSESAKQSARLRKTRPKTAGKNKSSLPAAFGTIIRRREKPVQAESETESYDDWPTSDSPSSLASLSTASLKGNSTESLPASPIYDPAPPITPACLRYMRAEMKRSDEHCFGSVASRHMDVSREARWEARMLDLQRRLNEMERERSGSQSRKWCLRSRRYS